MDRPIIIDERRGLNISLGLLFHFLISAVLIALGYSAMRGEINEALEQSRRNQEELQKAQVILDKTRMDVNTVGIKLDDLIRNYELDMKRYVRNEGDRR